MNYYDFNDIAVGHQESFSVEITEAMMDSFREISGDVSLLHKDLAYCKSEGYPAILSFGMLTCSFLSTLSGVYLPGERSLTHAQEMRFIKPVYIGDHLTITGTVKEKDERFQVFKIKVTVRNQHNELVARGKLQNSCRKRKATQKIG